ncbi:anti-apoptotic protein NR13-like [Oxyura jamaicensis]|uniref:anti-apoptotic protein NR13-like n=1 Tax=Oxyura jamaicensis TaxID=8884 RepID=UPI0015A6ADD6|nr:anti-apoptotic protein NR13-like [Oxyura jamaicensis]
MGPAFAPRRPKLDPKPEELPACLPKLKRVCPLGLLALVVFAGTLAAALAESGCEEGPRRLAEALAAYLAEERGEWLQAHGGWDGFCRFFGRHGSQPADQNSTISNAIMAAAGFGIAGLAFLLVVR